MHENDENAQQVSNVGADRRSVYPEHDESTRGDQTLAAAAAAAADDSSETHRMRRLIK